MSRYHPVVKSKLEETLFMSKKEKWKVLGNKKSGQDVVAVKVIVKEMEKNLNVREEALAEDDIFQLSTNCLNHLHKSFNNTSMMDVALWCYRWTEWMRQDEWVSGWGEVCNNLSYFGCEISVEELLLVPQVV